MYHSTDQEDESNHGIVRLDHNRAEKEAIKRLLQEYCLNFI